MDKIVVLNVGGSILSPSDDVLFDFKTANNLKSFIQSLPDYKFILCVGGGSITRKYQKLLQENNYSINSQHEAGVALINVNAVMLKAVLEDISEDNVLKYDDFKTDSSISFSKQVLISAAGAPGHSSDWNTIKLALRAGVNNVYSLTNIDGVYNKNPKEFTDAVLQPNIKWQQYLDIIGNPTEHLPGAKYPVDPLAANLGLENNVEFYVLSGDNLDNLKKAVNNEDFLGTKIS